MRKLVLAVALATAAAASTAIGVEAMGNETINYSYDAKGRLVKVEHSGSVNNNVVANYAYDDADNRLNLNVTGAP